MSLLAELIKAISEAVAEAQEQGRPRAPTQGVPLPAFADPRQARGVQEPVRALDAQQVAARQTIERVKATAWAAAQAAAVAANAKAKAQAQAAVAKQRARPPVGPDRLVRLLRQPATVRELVVLKELLDRPLALRRSRR